MSGADVGVHDIIVTDADVCALIGGTGINARAWIGNRPQGTLVPAVTVNVNFSDPQNVKGTIAPSDFTEVYVYSYSRDAATGRDLANKVRAAIDGKKDIETTNGVSIELIWFADEQYFDDLIEDNTMHHYEHRYFVKVKN